MRGSQAPRRAQRAGGERSPVCLVVLDGFGLGDGGPSDATALADAPFFARANRLYPRARIATSGPAVGLPEGQMGNSEVGHMTLGAGRIIHHDLVRIQQAIETGALGALPAFAELLDAAARAGGVLHLFGLVSDGGVHSSLDHLYGILAVCGARGIRPWLHAFTDGRDTAPQSALTWLGALEQELRRLGGGVATLSGRYWAMDRDKRWARVARAYRAIALREGDQASSAVEAVEKGYARGEGDEFIAPTLIAGGVPLTPGYAALFFNFRADRARQLTNALTRVQPGQLGAELAELPLVPAGRFATLSEYDETFGLPVLFGPQEIRGGLGELVSQAGMRQLRIAETEKYAHVTYFFNGGEEQCFKGEERILIPSPTDVDTYDQKPEMSALQVTDALLAALERVPFDFVLVNYANPDMVGHTGVIPAGVRAVETVDACLDRLAAAVLARGGSLLVTADHGNIELLVDPETGGPHTAHTTNPVPLWWISQDPAGCALADGGLADLAPSLCELLGLTPSAAMTGRSLIRASA
jgi:2,3-bisphosphoglycerate-independent phosphoglycerate mutase